jgi:hypothetical protein
MIFYLWEAEFPVVAVLKSKNHMKIQVEQEMKGSKVNLVPSLRSSSGPSRHRHAISEKSWVLENKINRIF